MFTKAEAERRGFASVSTLAKAIKCGDLPTFVGDDGRSYIRKSDLIAHFGNIDAGIAYQVLGTGDLAARWKMSVQAIHKRIKNDLLFPEDIGKINSGRIAVFLESDIRDYQAMRPELLDLNLREHIRMIKGAYAGKLNYNGQRFFRVREIYHRRWSGYTTGKILENTDL